MRAFDRCCLCRGLLAAALAVAARSVPAGDFAIRDGDTVVFLGDSVTAAGTYGKIVENYTLLRFPGRKVRFINAGFGGDTAAGGLKRLDRDVLDRGATLVTVACGTNDIGWGALADAEHKKAYLDGVRGIVAACRRRNVRVYLCSAPVTAADPNTSEDGFLQKMCDEGMALSRSLGGESIDVQRAMRTVQKRVWAVNQSIKDPARKVSLHAADGVHLNDLGQLAMAFAILKGLGAPADVSSAVVDAQSGKLVEAKGCAVSGVKADGPRVEFTRLDDGLPFNGGLFYALNFLYVPVPDELNRYMLAVKGLPEGKYEVTADGRGVGTFTAGQLAAGANIASTTANAWQPGGPWNAQANVLEQLTDARFQLRTARLLAGLYLPGDAAPETFAADVEKANAQIESMQRTIARPRPYRFVVRPAP